MTKVLTVKNPWAYLICTGIKDVENRSRQTNYRGKILIHSSKSIDPNHKHIPAMLSPLRWNKIPLINSAIIIAEMYDNSCIIGEVEIVDCIKNSTSIWADSGQWHWILKNPIMYDKPIENIKGQLGIWNLNK